MHKLYPGYQLLHHLKWDASEFLKKSLVISCHLLSNEFALEQLWTNGQKKLIEGVTVTISVDISASSDISIQRWFFSTYLFCELTHCDLVIFPSSSRSTSDIQWFDYNRSLDWTHNDSLNRNVTWSVRCKKCCLMRSTRVTSSIIKTIHQLKPRLHGQLSNHCSPSHDMVSKEPAEQPTWQAKETIMG